LKSQIAILHRLEKQAILRFRHSMIDCVIRTFARNDRDWLVGQHQRLYARDDGFDDTFGSLVGEIADAFLVDHDPKCEAGWIAETSGLRLGSIFCVRQRPTTAKLRLFLVVPEARGQGLGRRLLETCMGFAKDTGYHDMQLWTHESHEAACALYRAYGWQLDSSKAVHSFGQDLVEQSWRYQF
jgi:GNAT superfamily N-acetyltransferase